MNTTELPRCPICRKGHLLPSTTHREFKPRGQTVRVELLASLCSHCGKETIRAKQHDENLQRLADRKHRDEYKGLLLGEEILALRHRYGLTQQAAAKIFGKTNITFSRYENEVTYPDESTTMLLSMAIAKPDALKWLADQAGEPVPLWQERCEDRRMSMHKVPGVPVNLRALKPVNFASPNPMSEKAMTGWHEVKRDARTTVEIEATIKLVGSSTDVIPMLEAA